MNRFKISLLLIFVISFYSCIPMVYNHYREKESKKLIKIVTSSYLPEYSKNVSIGEALSKISNNNIEWYGSNNSVNCRFVITYHDPYYDRTKRLYLAIFFDIDPKTKKITVNKIWELQNNKWYSTPDDIDYVLSAIYKKYSM